eukprot:gene7449-10153_t
MTSTAKVAVIGDIFCDILTSGIVNLPQWEADTLSNGIELMAGGGGLNTCKHAENYAIWSNKNIVFSLCSVVGEDYWGTVCLESLQSLNMNIINTEFILKDQQFPTGVCIVLSSLEKASRGFISCRGWVGEMMLDQFNFSSIIQHDHIHIAGYFNLSKIKPNLPNFLEKVVTANENITISLNPQYDAHEIWDGIEEISCYLTILICNQNELFKITKLIEVNEAVELVLSWGCKIIVVTNGENGAGVFSYDTTINFDDVKFDLVGMNIDVMNNSNGDKKIVHLSLNAFAVDKLDTTGAGDAFAGAFLVDWVSLLKNNQSNLGDISAHALCAGILGGAAAVTESGGSRCSTSSLNGIILSNSIPIQLFFNS